MSANGRQPSQTFSLERTGAVLIKEFIQLTRDRITYALILAVPVVMTYLDTGLVPRLPTAVLSAALMILAFLALTCGLILDTVTRARREIKRLAYLSLPAPGTPVTTVKSPSRSL